MGNDPVNLTDPSGGLNINFGNLGAITGSVLGDRLLATGAGALIGFGIDKLTGGDGWKGAAIGGGVGLGATFVPPFDISVVTNWTKDWLPGIVAAPVSGTINALGGVVGTLGGITKGDKVTASSNLSNIGKGLLEIVGLKEALTEKWTNGPTGGKLPQSFTTEMQNLKIPDDAWKNGMHAWHAGDNALLSNKLGRLQHHLFS